MGNIKAIGRVIGKIHVGLKGAGRIRTESDSAIETPMERRTITTIIEGSLKAFDIRSRNYSTEPDGV